MKTRTILWMVIVMAGILGYSYADKTKEAALGDKASVKQTKNLETAVFAGGCFWCMEASFEKVNGVVEAVPGYAGGEKPDPTYEEVSSGTTKYLESVRVTYDPAIVTYEALLNVFWHQVDPTDAGGSFADRGSQYRSAVFYQDEKQKQLASDSRDRLERSGRYDKPIVTEIRPFTTFYPAEAYHQDYYKNHSLRYKYYRYGSGRDQYLAKIWKKVEDPDVLSHSVDAAKTPPQYDRPSDEGLKKRLTPLQYAVTQEDGTEPPFDNPSWDNKKPGIYVDIVSGEPLFSSTDKYDSGTGWPSFTKPITPDAVVEKEDRFLLVTRTEVRSRHAGSHLGHVFDDGPPPTGLRYCMNSAALRFVPKKDLEKEGYGEFLALFK